MTLRPVRRVSQRRGYDPGPPCATCGLAVINVVHHDAIERRRNIESWAAPSPSMDGKNYYDWADVTYHPFVPSEAQGRKPL